VLERLSDEPESLREGEGWLASLREFGRVIDALSLPEAENMVHWYERELGQTILYLTPLDVASILSERLYPLLDVAILTSATLSLAGDFAYIHRALGLGRAFDRADGVVVESPFSYQSRMRILVPEDFPSVQSDGDTYADALASLLVGLHRRLRRNGLVLFTSYELLQRVRERIHHLVPTLAQGVDGSRSKLVERFRSGRDGMLLLGVDSFWEGIDLPGEQLEYLVVTRLPFAVPSDPVQSALSEEYLRRGEDPFVRLALPQGILRLRQGVGRLIRTQKDRGVVVLTDDRILKRGYGKRFVASLPAPLERYSSTAEVLQAAGDWFAHEGELV
jgi:ATP-dependent DNA helicase DinG